MRLKKKSQNLQQENYFKEAKKLHSVTEFKEGDKIFYRPDDDLGTSTTKFIPLVITKVCMNHSIGETIKRTENDKSAKFFLQDGFNNRGIYLAGEF